MHNTRTLYYLLSRTTIPSNSKVFPPRLLFKIKILDVDHFYEPKCRLCANESKMTDVIDFENSYAFPVDIDELRIILSRAARHNL